MNPSHSLLPISLLLLSLLSPLQVSSFDDTAIVTIIASPEYVELLATLTKSLENNWPQSNTISKYCICVGLKPMVEDQVKKLGYQVLSYSRHFLYAHAELRKALTRNEIRGKYKYTWDKIYAFTALDSYKRVILMDADMTVRKPLDTFLSLPMGEKGEKVWVVEGRNGWNSGLVIFYPGGDLGEHIVSELKKDPSGYLKAGFDLGGGGWLMGEQLFLNGYFGKFREVNYLEPQYNCIFNKNDDCFIFHFAGKRRRRWKRATYLD